MKFAGVVKAFTLAMAACSACSSRAEIVENRSFSGPKTTIRYALWGGADEVGTARLFCQQFVKLHPEVRLDVAVYPWGQYWAKLQTQMASGLAPDVMAFYSGSFGEWVARGALYPLDDLAKQSGFTVKDYYPQAIENCSWDGKLFTIPTDIAIWSMVYSTDRLEESGIPKSEWPRADKAMTWDEFLKLSKRLTLRGADGKIVQYGMSAGQEWDLAMCGMYGGSFVDRPVNPTKSTAANNEALIRGFTELFQNQYADSTTLGAAPLSAGAFTNNSDTILISPKFAMGTTGPWALRQLRDAGVQFGVTPMPQGPHPHNLISVNSAGIYAHSKHVKEAWEFVAFLTSGDREKEVGLRMKGIPSLISATPYLIHNSYNIPGAEAFLEDLKIAEPTMTADATAIVSARDNWLNSTDEAIEAEHDARLGSLPKTNGKVSAADYQKYVAAMNDFIAKTVRRRMPEMDANLSKAIYEDHLPPPTPLVKFVLPLLAVLGLIGVGAVYVRGVGKTRQSEAAGLEGEKVGKTGYWFISPWLIGFSCFVLGPILAAVALSFTDWNMIRSPHWIGFQNYLQMATDKNFLIGLKVTFLYALLVIPISLLGGLFTAGLLTMKIRGTDLFKAIIYFPALFTGAETAVLWTNMLNKEHGVLNYILSWLHISPVDWMDARHAFFSVILMNVFWIGGAMIIYYAGMKQIPAALYEAAELDGATVSRKFLSITIPMLSPVILFMVVMTTIGSFQVFTPALFFTDSSASIGSPDNSLRFYAVNIYDKAFNNLEMGGACSYAIVLFLIIFAITFVQLKLANRFVHSENIA
ncbi:MAG TPA: extracellular solute-binding protein [Fimbriimonas sp.]|nr:extracellular solute-binding protein [Fimbriimonas sp.]